jgi:hypothetical protein
VAFGGAYERPEFRGPVVELAEAEQTPAEAKAQQRRRIAATAAVAATVAATGDEGDGSAVGQVPAKAARATAAGAILSALVAFLAVQRARVRSWLSTQLRTRQPSVPLDDVAALIDEEERRGAEFEKRSAARFARDLTTALAIPDKAAREAAIRGITSREQRYARQRDEAMAARAFAAVDRIVLKGESPQGAYWWNDPTVSEHTAGCLIMGGKFWPWAVLDRVHPPRHGGCPCRLRGYGEAIADGLMSPGDVVDVQTAIRRAAHVVMEGVLTVEMPEDAEALIEAAGGRDLLELRGGLLEAGLVADESMLDRLLDETDLSEAFNPTQARWPKGHPKAGQWRPKVGGSGFGARTSAGWLKRDLDELRTMAAPQHVGTSRTGDGPEVPVMHTPSSPAELRAVGARVAAVADRHGAHHAYRQRIDELHVERRKLSDAHSDRLDAAGGISHFFDEEDAAAKRAGREPDNSAVVARMDALRPEAERERLRAIDAEVQRLLPAEEQARVDALLGVLAEIRPMGGTKLNVSKVEGADRIQQREELPASLREASRYVPRAWLDDSNAKGSIRFVVSEERAHHLLEDKRGADTPGMGHAEQEKSVDELLKRDGWKFAGYEMGVFPVLRDPEGKLHAISWSGAATTTIGVGPNRHEVGADPQHFEAGARKPYVPPPIDSKIRVKAGDPSTLLHELAHRFEQVYGEPNALSGQRPLMAATQRFLRDRRGAEMARQLDELRPGHGYEPHERAWEDEFVDPYIGKDYGARATEVLTMGMQMLFFPTYGREFDPPKSRGRKGDAEMRDFILGVMAAL